jgi:mono/diheme cytochrome c family protein
LIRNRLHFSYSIACYSASPLILRTPELLDKPITPPPTAPTIVIAVLGVYQSRRTDPYIQSVLSLTGDPVQGQVIFQLNCAVCHGINGQGLVGPRLSHVASRKSRVGIIEQVISGDTPPMPQFQPSPETMADLLEYLETL